MISIESCVPNNKPVLVFNAAEGLLQLVFGNRNKGQFHYEQMRVQDQAMKFLPPAIKQCLDTYNYSIQELHGIAVVRGPGAFTGLRVVLALAMGLVQGARIGWAGMEYLPLLAAGPKLEKDVEVWVCTYARKNLVYIQGFKSVVIEPLTKAAVLDLNQAKEMLLSRIGRIILLGSGVRRNLDFWSQLPDRMEIISMQYDNPSPEILMESAFRQTFSNKPIEPMYLRLSDAENNLDKIAKERGVQIKDFYAWAGLKKC